MECCLVSSVAEDRCMPLPLLCSQPGSLRPLAPGQSTGLFASHQHTHPQFLPLGIFVSITWMTTVHTSSSSHTNAHLHMHRSGMPAYFESRTARGEKKNRLEVSVLKIQKPGTFTWAGQKNSTVLLPSQLVLLTENQCSATASVCVECKGGKNSAWSPESDLLLFISCNSMTAIVFT